MRAFMLRAACVFVLAAGLAWPGVSAMASGRQERAKDPVCGMSLETAKAKHSTTYNDVTYYFCSDDCYNKFKADPAKYVSGDAQATKVKDPVCGMAIDASKAKYSTTYNDKKYYFCSESCLNKFKADPGKYTK